MIGCKTKKVIGLIVYAMKCAKCRAAKNKCSPVTEHDCPVNYVGSSKGMEATAALEMIISVSEIFEGKVYVKCIVSEDDRLCKLKQAMNVTISMVNYLLIFLNLYV